MSSELGFGGGRNRIVCGADEALEGNDYGSVLRVLRVVGGNGTRLRGREEARKAAAVARSGGGGVGDAGQWAGAAVGLAAAARALVEKGAINFWNNGVVGATEIKGGRGSPGQ